MTDLVKLLEMDLRTHVDADHDDLVSELQVKAADNGEL